MIELSERTTGELRASVGLLVYALNKTRRPSTLGTMRAVRDALDRAIKELTDDELKPLTGVDACTTNDDKEKR